MINIIYLFSIYSILGWIVETVYFLIKTTKFHKRGILNGVYCPLYGFSLVICTLLVQNNKYGALISFLLCALVCTSFELITGILFDKVLNKVMWNYKNNKFNLGGYICPLFSVIWGITALSCIKFLNPILLSTFNSIKLIFGISVIIFMILDLLSIITHKFKA